MTEATGKTMQKRKLIENLWGYFFIIPAIFFFSIFVVYPLVDSIKISLFTNVKGTLQWAGLKNYTLILHDKVFIKSLINTFVYVAYIVPAVVCLSLFLAINILNKKPAAQTFFRASFYLPSVISIVSVSLVWRNLYNYNFGILNFLLAKLNLPMVNWIGNDKIVIMSLSIIVVTILLGMPLILYLASISGIPNDYYDAAEIDGAGAWSKFRNITLPFTMPTTLYVFVTTTIASFQVFGVIDLITAGGPAYASTTVMYYLYKTAFNFNNFNKASAMGVILFLCIAVFASVQFKGLSKSIEY